MGFFLEYSDKSVYISDSYLRNELLNDNQSSSPSMNESEDLSNLSENDYIIDNDDKALLAKLNQDIRVVNMNELLDSLLNDVDEKNIDIITPLLNLNRAHLLTVLYLYYLKKINLIGIKEILYASANQTRTDILLGYLDDLDGNTTTINLLGPLFDLLDKTTGYPNKDIETFEKILPEINNTKLNAPTFIVNAGNYYYEAINSNSEDSLMKSCTLNEYLDLFPNVIEELELLLGYTSKKVFNKNKPEELSKIFKKPKKFKNWWRTFKNKGFDEIFCKKNIILPTGEINENILAVAACNEARNFCNYDKVIRESFRIGLNSSLKIAKTTFNNYRYNYELKESKSDSIYNIFSYYDSRLINNTNYLTEYGFYKRNVNGNFGTMLNHFYGDSNNYIPGKIRNDAAKDFIALIPEGITISEATKETERIETLMNGFSSLTGCTYKYINSKYECVKNDIILNNGYFIKNVLKYNPLDFNPVEYMNKNFLKAIKEKNDAAYDYFIDKKTDYNTKGILKYTKDEYIKANMFGMDPNIFSIEFVIEKNSDGTYSIINFGRDNIRNNISAALKSNNIKYSLSISDSETKITNVLDALKNALEKIDNEKVNGKEPYSNLKKTFLNFVALNILKKYLEYLTDKTETKSLSDCLKLDPENGADILIINIYKYMSLLRNTIVELKNAINTLNRNALYGRIFEDPFRDNENIKNIEKYYRSNKEALKSSISESSILNLYVEKTSKLLLYLDIDSYTMQKS